MRALVLAAGLGTRLRPLTEELPKPLVPVLDRPLIAWTMDWLHRQGISHVVLNTHHQHDAFGPVLARYESKLGVSTECLFEPDILGTGGAIRNALPALGASPFVVFNGDVLTTPSISELRTAHESSDAFITLVLQNDPTVPLSASIEVDERGRVVRMLGQGEAISNTQRCMFSGVYMVSPAIAPWLPSQGCILRSTARELLHTGRVRAVVQKFPWFDLGNIQAYASTTLALASGSVVLDCVPLSHANDRVWSGDRAMTRVAQGSRHVVVGHDAVLQADMPIEHVIVWPDSKVLNPPSNSIVTSSGRVVPIPL